MFLMPALLLFPLKVVALWLIAAGPRNARRQMVIVLAKVLGTGAARTHVHPHRASNWCANRWFAATLECGVRRSGACARR
jgi:hypothetical protein